MGLLDNRNDSAKVWTLLPEIEAELKAGAKRPEIFEALKEKHGLTLTYDGFLSALKRARKKAKTCKNPAQQAAQEKTVESVEEVAGNTPELAPQPNNQPAEEEIKRGIISRNDFKPSADIDEKITKLTGKNRKY